MSGEFIGRFYDTHAHLDFPPFVEDMASTISRFEQAGIKHVMIPAVSRDRFDALINLSLNHPNVFSIALGLHPLYIESHTHADLVYLESLLTTNQVPAIKAIGEIGLDSFLFNLSSAPIFDKQVEFLMTQLDMANQFELPVILHSRRTHSVLLSLLKQAKVRRCGVVHGFSGSYEQALAFVKLGYKIGVGGTITYSRANKTRIAVSRLPLESLLLETDAPDMPMDGRQGEVNRSEYLLEVFNELCTLRVESPDVIAKQIWQTSQTLFN